ncbi:hypothetical protein BLOT_015253 [Blomia tropicalis]|nr:hypothetical protein BLOT_015253 [Blomia tropicalis]
MKRLKYFPYLTISIRLRLVLLNSVLILIMFLFMFGTVIVLITGSTYFIFILIIPKLDGSQRKLWTCFIDAQLVCCCAFQTIRMILFQLQALILVNRAHNYVSNNADCKIRNAVRLVRAGQCYLYKLSLILKHFYFINTDGLINAINGNQYILSPVVFAGFVSNFMLNIYLITAIYFFRMGIGELALCWSLIMVQVLFTIITLLSARSWSKSLYVSAHVLQPAQYCLKGLNYLNEKFKLMTYFELVHTTNHFNFSVGPLGKINNNSIFEFYFFYSGYLMFIFAYYLANSDYESYFEYDIIISIAHKLNLYSIHTAISLTPFTYFVWVYDYQVNVCRYNYIWKACHDLMVKNGRNFYALNSKFRPRFSWLEPNNYLKQIKTINHWTYQRKTIYFPIQFDMNRLKYFPYLTNSIRVRLVLFNSILGFLGSFFMFGTVTTLAAGSIYFLFIFILPNINGSQRKLWTGFIDVQLICFCAFQTLRMVNFQLQALVLINRAHKYVLFNLDKKIRNAVRLIRIGRCNPYKLSLILKRYRCLNTDGLINAINGNDHILSPVIFAGFVSNFMLNIYLVSAIYFFRMRIGELLLCWCLMLSQILFANIALFSAKSFSNCLYISAHELQPAQYCLKRSYYLKDKFKLMTYFELIHSTNHFNFNVGPIGKINAKSIFEFYFFYSGYLMFIFAEFRYLQPWLRVGIAISPFTYFVWYYDYEVNIRRFNYIWKACHDLMVKNGRNFYALNPNFCPHFNWKRPWNYIQQLKTIYRWTLHPKTINFSIQFDTKRLNYFPYITKSLRLRLVLLNSILVLLSTIFMVGTILILIAGSIYFMFIFIQPNIGGSQRKLWTGFIDVQAICCCAYQTIRMILFQLQALILVNRTHVIVLHNIDKKIQNAVRLIRSGRFYLHRLSLNLKYFRFLNTDSLINAVNGNEHILSPVFFAGFISNFLLNISLVSTIYFFRMGTGELILCWFLMIVQVLFTIITLFSARSWAESFYISAHVLQSAQYCFKGSNHLKDKFKLTTTLELIHTSEHFNFTTGPIAFVIYRSKYYEYFEYDVLISIARSLNYYSIFMAIGLSPFTYFVWYYDYEVNIRRFNYIWKACHDLMVKNGRNFYALNPNFRPRFNWKKPLNYIQQLKTIYHWNLHPKTINFSIQFDTKRLNYFPYITKSLRLRLVLLNSILVLISTIFMVGTVLVLIAGSIYFMFIFIPPNIGGSQRKLWTGFIDVQAICFCAYQTIRMILFQLQALILVNRTHVIVLHNIDKKIQNAVRLVRSGRFYLHRLSLNLKYFRFLNTDSLINAVNGNEHILSPVFFAGFISNFLLNICLVSTIYFFRMGIGELILCWFLMIVQILFTVITLFSARSWAKSLYISAHVLQSAQYCFKGSNHLKDKFKLTTTFELIHTSEHFNFTTGPIGKINTSSIFEFLSFYSGYLMFIFGMIQNSEIRKMNNQYK